MIAFYCCQVQSVFQAFPGCSAVDSELPADFLPCLALLPHFSDPGLRLYFPCMFARISTACQPQDTYWACDMKGGFNFGLSDRSFQRQRRFVVRKLAFRVRSLGCKGSRRVPGTPYITHFSFGLGPGFWGVSLLPRDFSIC